MPLKKRTVSRAVILPYKQGSASAKRLALKLSETLGLKVRRVRPDGAYRPRLRSLVVNYGSNTAPGWWPVNPVNTLNSPAACAVAGNKLRAFQAFKQHGVVTPEWTTDQNTATNWMNSGNVVVCRTLLNSHSGRGIILASNPQRDVASVPRAPLYVKYKKKKKEFRVHVFQGRVLDVAEKRRVRRENRPETYDGYIRNHANGWVFCRDSIVEPSGIRDLAVSAAKACGLDFGAVDIIWNEKEDKCYVLEINTAPGIEGTTLEKYTQALTTWIRSK